MRSTDADIWCCHIVFGRQAEQPIEAAESRSAQSPSGTANMERFGVRMKLGEPGMERSMSEW